MRLVAVIEDPAVIEEILTHVGLWQRGPPPSHVVLEAADLALQLAAERSARAVRGDPYPDPTRV